MPEMSSSTQIILMMIGVIIAFMVIGIFKNQLKIVLKFIIKGGVGVLAIGSINFVLGLIGINAIVGVNIFNALIIGFLGIPGFFLVYVLGFIG